MSDNFGSYDPNKQQTGRFQKSKKFYLEDGSNVYRVLPPTKSLRDSNKIAQFWSIIWLTDSNNKKRPVASILKKQNKQVVQNDPLIDKLEQLKAEMAAAVARGENSTVLSMMKENLNRIQNFKQYALNVISTSGEYGVLEIPYTSYINLEQRLRQLGNEGIDAIGVGPDKGLFLDFKRLRDERGKSIYPVDPATKTSKDANGNYTINYIRAPLTNEEAERLANQARDLTTLYKTYTYEEMDALSTLDQRVFDAVFAKPQPVVEESDTSVDNETQKELVKYENTQQQSLNAASMGKIAAMTQTNNVGTSNAAAGSSNTTHNFTTKPPAGPVFTQGSVVDNKKVQNFLFPDKKSN